MSHGSIDRNVLNKVMLDLEIPVVRTQQTQQGDRASLLSNLALEQIKRDERYPISPPRLICGRYNDRGDFPHQQREFL